MNCILIILMVLSVVFCFKNFMLDLEMVVNVEKLVYVIVIYGGVGIILLENIIGEQEVVYWEVLNIVLMIGEDIFNVGGSSWDVVE